MIRKAEKKDISNVANLWLKYIKEEFPDNCPRLDWFIDILNRNIDSPNYYILIAEVDGEAVGFIDGIFSKDACTGKEGILINYLYAIPRYRLSKEKISEKLQRELYHISDKYKLDFRKIMCSVENMEFWLFKDYKFQAAIMEA